MLKAIIESLENNYSAYIENVDGIVATGSTIEEIKTNLKNAVVDYVETCAAIGCAIPEELQNCSEIEFTMDVKSLLKLYAGIFSKAGLERLTGINQKQLWHYANGGSIPRRPQVQRIEKAIHRLGNELISIHL